MGSAPCLSGETSTPKSITVSSILQEIVSNILALPWRPIERSFPTRQVITNMPFRAITVFAMFSFFS